jgi:hypothetical protein
MAGFIFKLDPEILGEALERERQPVSAAALESAQRTFPREDSQQRLTPVEEVSVVEAQTPKEASIQADLNEGARGWVGDVASSPTRLEADRAEADRQLQLTDLDQARLIKEKNASVAAAAPTDTNPISPVQKRPVAGWTGQALTSWARLEAERAEFETRSSFEKASLLAEEEKLARQRAAEAVHQAQLADEIVEQYRNDAERAIASVDMQSELATKFYLQSIGKTVDEEATGNQAPIDSVPVVTLPNQLWPQKESPWGGATRLPAMPKPQTAVAKPLRPEVFSFPQATTTPTEGETVPAATLAKPKILGSAFTQRADGGSCPSLPTP